MADTVDGIPIEFISQERLQEQSFDEKLDMVIQEVKDGKILVLEESLSPDEKTDLIQATVEQVSEDFPGIEFSGLEGGGDVFDRILDNLYGVVGRERRRGLTIVGNSDVMEKVEEAKDSVSLLAKAGER